jgi:hypothetical protein
MAVIRLAGFGGENRALHPSLLPEAVGTISRNQRPGRGDLRAWLQPLAVATVPSGRKSIYRIGRDVASHAQYWLSWTSSPVHAVRGFDPSDTTERTYFTGDGAPKVTDNLALDVTDPQDNPTASRPLGLPAPASGPSVATVAGGASTLNQTVYYVYTYVSDWGWESAPSPPSAANSRKADDTATISGFAAVPAGNYNVTLRRIYRTATGATGATEFFFLREIAIGTSSTTDDNRTLGEVLPTTTWLPAPGVPYSGTTAEGNLSHLTAMWNGMLAGIVGNAVRVCEPYTPYAWPREYEVVPPDCKPVALGVFGQNLLVLTTGRPLLVQGSTPEGLDQTPLDMPQGCISARSAVSMGAGVAWASEDGLCWFGGSGGGRMLTNGIMLRKDWQALVPSTIVGRLYEGLYFGSYSDDGGATRKGFMVSPADGAQGLYFLDTGYEGMHFDELLDQLYVLSGTNVQRWDAGGASMTYRFRSKAFRAPRPMNFGCAEVLADAYPVTFRLYADGTLRHTQTVASAETFRLPSGYMATDWQIELEGSGAVQSAAMATSIAELAEV